jgi:hypothetical protein
MVTTTEFVPTQLSPKKMKQIGSTATATVAFGSSVGSTNGWGVGGFLNTLTSELSTVRIPFKSGTDGKMVILADYICANSTAYFACCAVRVPPNSTFNDYAYPGPAWRAPKQGIGTSTAETAWYMIRSTLALYATSTASIGNTYAIGPIESAQFGMAFLTASSNNIDQGQPFIECMFGLSSVASTGTWAAMSTNTILGVISIAAFELP